MLDILAAFAAAAPEMFAVEAAATTAAEVAAAEAAAAAAAEAAAATAAQQAALLPLRKQPPNKVLKRVLRKLVALPQMRL